MVLQMDCPAEHLLFVSSDLEDKEQAESEIARWARRHGYCTPQSDRTYAIYQNGIPTREWRLLERNLA